MGRFRKTLQILIITIVIITTTTTTTTNTHGSNVVESSSNSADATLIQFLKDLQQRDYYNTILVMHNSNATIATTFYVANHEMEKQNQTCNTTLSDYLWSGGFDVTTSLGFKGHLMQQMPQVPVFLLNEVKTFSLREHISDFLLAILQIDVNVKGIRATFDEHRQLFRALRQNVLHMAVVKVILLINYPVQMVEEDTQLIAGVVDELLRHCWQLQFINVIAILSNYKTCRILHRFDPFPTFQLETIPMATNPAEQIEVFPNRLANLKGYRMPIILGGTEPRVIYYNTSDGELFVGGFVGHYMWAFAQIYNCSLYHPIPFNPYHLTPSPELMKAVVNNTVEWSVGITFPLETMNFLSYPYEYLDWCLMIPLEADIPGYKFFTSVLNGDTYLLVISSTVVISMVLSAALYLNGHRPDWFDVFFHDNCLRGLLGQSFIEIPNTPKVVRAIYLDICILGILLTTAYNAYFSTYVTKAPKEAARNDLDDVLASGLKIIASATELPGVLRHPDLKKYAPFFIPIPDFQKYVDLRDSFDTKYGYVVPNTKWTIVNEQQKIFTTPLFKQTPGFCMVNGIPMCFPVRENSVFLDLLNKLINRVYESGLMNFWRRYNFLELIKAGKLKLADLSTKKEFKAMKLDDLRYIFVFTATMLLVVLIVFAIEFLVFHRKRIFG